MSGRPNRFWDFEIEDALFVAAGSGRSNGIGLCSERATAHAVARARMTIRRFLENVPEEMSVHEVLERLE